jgi:hypothetical protein
MVGNQDTYAQRDVDLILDSKSAKIIQMQVDRASSEMGRRKLFGATDEDLRRRIASGETQDPNGASLQGILNDRRNFGYTDEHLQAYINYKPDGGRK